MELEIQFFTMRPGEVEEVEMVREELSRFLSVMVVPLVYLGGVNPGVVVELVVELEGGATGTETVMLPV